MEGKMADVTGKSLKTAILFYCSTEIFRGEGLPVMINFANNFRWDFAKFSKTGRF